MIRSMDSATGEVVFWAVAIVATLWLIRAGWRGWRVGKDVVCRRCEYALVGLPETSDRCPECGTEVSLAEGTNVGIGRRKRSLLTVAGAFLLLLACGWMEWGSVNAWITRPARELPTWLLLNHVERTALNRGEYLGELRRRADSDQLSAGQRSRLIDAMIAQYTRTNMAWLDGSPAWIFQQRTVGLASDAQWKRLFDTLPPEYAIRPVVAAGEPFMIANPYSPLRQNNPHNLEYVIDAVSIDGRKLKHDWSGIDIARDLPDLSAGRHELKVEVSARIRSRPFDPKIGEWRGTFTLPFEYKTSGSSVELVTDPAVIAQARKNTSVGVEVEGGTLWLEVQAPANSHLSHSIYLREPDGTERRTWTIPGGPNRINTRLGIPNPLKPETTKVDVILKPDRAAAAKSPHVIKMLDAQLEYKDVPVKQVAK